MHRILKSCLHIEYILIISAALSIACTAFFRQRAVQRFDQLDAAFMAVQAQEAAGEYKACRQTPPPRFRNCMEHTSFYWLHAHAYTASKGDVKQHGARQLRSAPSHCKLL